MTGNRFSDKNKNMHHEEQRSVSAWEAFQGKKEDPFKGGKGEKEDRIEPCEEESVAIKRLRIRFMGKVAKSQSCWIWMASVNKDGYGYFRLGASMAKAHRVSWKIHKGEILGGLSVLHKCDNPSCVNPDHLWLGTQSDNIRDMHEKGRANKASGLKNGAHIHPERLPRGERNGRSKISGDIVLAIRSMRDSGSMGIEIAKRFNVSPATVSKIIRRESWAHIP